MLLATASDILTALGVDETDEVTEAVTAALHAAEATLASDLRTEFGQAEIDDLFFVKGNGLSCGLLRTRFRLSRGFVSADGLRVLYAPSLSMFDDEAVDISDKVSLDAEKGVVVDNRTVLDDMFVKITGSAGFAVDRVNAEAYDPSVVPGWLKELAKIQARITLDAHPVFSELEVKQDVKALRAQRDAIVAQKVRYVPGALQPINR